MEPVMEIPVGLVTFLDVPRFNGLPERAASKNRSEQPEAFTFLPQSKHKDRKGNRIVNHGYTLSRVVAGPDLIEMLTPVLQGLVSQYISVQRKRGGPKKKIESRFVPQCVGEHDERTAIVRPEDILAFLAERYGEGSKAEVQVWVNPTAAGLRANVIVHLGQSPKKAPNSELRIRRMDNGFAITLPAGR